MSHVLLLILKITGIVIACILELVIIAVAEFFCAGKI